MCINILFVLFVGNIFGILAASNIGYVLAHVFALSAYILLRKDRPLWPRPIKLPNYWMYVAGFLCASFILFSIVGVAYFQNAAGGYGKGAQVKIIGFGVLIISLLLFFYRRKVQDKEQIHWKEDTPEVPPTVTAAGAPVAGS
jgi:amino acid transporter